MIFFSTIITGLQFPVYAAAGCAVWTLSRISYTRGYITGDPKKVGTSVQRISSRWF